MNNDEIELHKTEFEPPEKPKKKFFLYKQVAWVCFAGSLFIFTDYFTAVNFKQETIQEIYTIQSRTGIIYEYEVVTNSGKFRCEGREVQLLLNDNKIEIMQTSFNKIIVAAKKENTYLEIGSNIYNPFFFFPLFSFIFSGLSLFVPVQNKEDLGYKFAIFSTLMLIFSAIIIFFTT